MASLSSFILFIKVVPLPKGITKDLDKIHILSAARIQLSKSDFFRNRDKIMDEKHPAKISRD